MKKAAVSQPPEIRAFCKRNAPDCDILISGKQMPPYPLFRKKDTPHYTFSQKKVVSLYAETGIRMGTYIKQAMKGIIRYGITTAIGLWCAIGGAAQDFTVRTLPTQPLLPTASIHCILQDTEGYLWYGTEEAGLCRDNGYQIDVFRPSSAADRQATCNIRCLAEDTSGCIFIGTAEGLFRLDKRDYSMTHIPIGDTDGYIEALLADRQGRTWVGTKGRVAVVDSTGKVLASHACQTDGKEASVSALYEDSQGTVFALLYPAGPGNARPEILRKRKQDKEFIPLGWPLAHTPMQMVEDQPGRRYWVLTRGAGIVSLQTEGGRCRTTLQAATMGGYGKSHGLSLLRDSRHGLLWCTTMDDLYVYAPDGDGQLRPFPTDGFLPRGGKILDQLHESRDGSIYVSGFVPHTFSVMPEQNDITRHDAPAIVRLTGFPLLADRSVTEDGHIWIWQGRQGLMLYRPETDEVAASPWKTMRCIARRTAGGIYATHDTCVFRLWHGPGMDLHREEVAHCPRDIRLLHEDRQQPLYIATVHSLYRFSPATRAIKKVADLPAPPQDLATDRRGNAYLTLGKDGLFHLSPQGSVRHMRNGENFLAASTAPDGTVWCSTHEGNVYNYAPETGQLHKEPFLCNADSIPVKDILADGLGHIWTLTDQQVREYAPRKQSFRTIRNTDPSVNVSYFYTLEAIAPNLVGINGAGALLQVQSDEALEQTAANVNVRISSVVSGGQSRLAGRTASRLEIEADETDIALRLTTLDPQYAANISFAYKLEDINRDWIYLPQGNNTVILSDLPQGIHTLSLKATDRYGCWGKPTEITLHKAAHWYETWWAYLIYIGLASAFLYGIYRLERRIRMLHRLIKRKQEVRLDEIELKKEEIASLQWQDDFLKTAIAKVEENLDRPEYNVEALSRDMCMSRITLNRHLQKQTGLSPKDFIRDIRLKKAATLLQQTPEASIADIARKVGFTTPNYFAKCFKEKFGILPKDYRPPKTES